MQMSDNAVIRLYSIVTAGGGDLTTADLAIQNQGVPDGTTTRVGFRNACG